MRKQFCAEPFLASLVVLVFIGVLEASAEVTNFTRLHSFGVLDEMGTDPSNLIVQEPQVMGTNNAYFPIFGLARGGAERAGLVWQMASSGLDYEVLHHFRPSLGEPASPNALVLGQGGLIGASGANNKLFVVDPAGGGLTELYDFASGPPANGSYPIALVPDSSVLYGLTYGGGTNGHGVLFKKGLSFQTYEVLVHFGIEGPPISLMLGSDGVLYGTTPGTIFRVNRDGTGYTGIYGYAGGQLGLGRLQEGIDRDLYCTTTSGGTYGGGILFKLAKDGSNFTVLWNFGDPNGPSPPPTYPIWLTISDRIGALPYGVAAGGGTSNRGAIFAFGEHPQELSVLHNFAGDDDDSPEIYDVGEQSWLYGFVRGTRNNFFKVEKNLVDGPIIPLRIFSQGGNDADLPFELVSTSGGAVYGLTQVGRTNNTGTLFKVNHDGSGYAVLDDFNKTNKGLGIVDAIEASDGALYGVAINTNQPGQPGEVFRLDKTGTGYVTIHLFTTNAGEARWPESLLEAGDGQLYGIAGGGSAGFGTIFKLNKYGSGFGVIHNFAGDPDDTSGANPLIEGSDGRLYGTSRGNCGSDTGAVFGLDKSGLNFSIMHRFGSAPSPGHPKTALLQGSDNALYGTTSGLSDACENASVVFKINQDGSGYREIWGPTYLELPDSPLLEGRDGALYGTVAVLYSPEHRLFKLRKDGTGYLILQKIKTAWFDASTGPSRKIMVGRDGAFYGVIPDCGDASSGLAFRYGHAFRIQLGPGRVDLTATGIPGYTYQFERSSNLQSWATLDTFQMPDNALFQYSDTNPPPTAAFYRMHGP